MLNFHVTKFQVFVLILKSGLDVVVMLKWKVGSGAPFCSCRLRLSYPALFLSWLVLLHQTVNELMALTF